MDHTMNGGSAVAFFCFSLRIQPFYPFQIVVLVEGEIEGRVSIASRAFVYTNAILLCKMLGEIEGRVSIASEYPLAIFRIFRSIARK